MAERVVHISQLTEDGVYVIGLESGNQMLACVASAEWLGNKDGVQLARLIAAAPGLLAALEEMASDPGGWIPEGAWERAEAAIAKAKGE